MDIIHDTIGTPVPESPIEIISFGYGHGPAPEAHAITDVRHHFRDPHVDPALRYLTAADMPVQHAVLHTPGIPRLIGSIVAMAHAFRRGPKDGPVRIAVGCVGGRHRSAVIAAEAARLLEEAGVPVTLTHRDIDKPVLQRTTAAAAPAWRKSSRSKGGDCVELARLLPGGGCHCCGGDGSMGGATCGVCGGSGQCGGRR